MSDIPLSLLFGSAHILDVVCLVSSDGENIGRVTYLSNPAMGRGKRFTLVLDMRLKMFKKTTASDGLCFGSSGYGNNSGRQTQQLKKKPSK